jgi:hypothetical protein
MGTFSSQIRPELVPFDYTDFSIHYDSAYAAMKQTKFKNGIQDISLANMLARRQGSYADVPHFSAEQEEAIGHYWSLVNIIAAIVESGETAENLLTRALDATGVHNDVLKVFQLAFYSSINNGDKDTSNDRTNKGKTDANYKNLRALGSTLHSGHVMGNYYSKTSKIIGKSMNGAGPSETMDLLVGHFCL